MAQDDLTVTSDVLLTERTGNVLVLTLNRPEVRNALNPELKDHLIRAMRDADADPDIRAVVITGNGPVFCAGMDLKAFAKGADFGGLAWLYKEGISKPVIGALNGPALAGGFELALACDLIIAAEDAKVGLPEVKRGRAGRERQARGHRPRAEDRRERPAQRRRHQEADARAPLGHPRGDSGHLPQQRCDGRRPRVRRAPLAGMDG